MKSFINTLKVFFENIFSIFKTFKRQKITGTSFVVILLLVLALIFTFMAAAPMLSPFVYPLF